MRRLDGETANVYEGVSVDKKWEERRTFINEQAETIGGTLPEAISRKK
jgi:hypothetical protein